MFFVYYFTLPIDNLKLLLKIKLLYFMKNKAVYNDLIKKIINIFINVERKDRNKYREWEKVREKAKEEER